MKAANVTNEMSEWDDALARRLYREHEILEAEGDPSGSLAKLEEAAALGADYALHDLGYTYYNAKPPKVRKALAAYGKAARKGEGASAWNIARHFELQPSPVRYFFWLRVALRLDVEAAEEELANPFPFLFLKSLDCLKDGKVDQALRTLKLMTLHGSKEAEAALQSLRPSSH